MGHPGSLRAQAPEGEVKEETLLPAALGIRTDSQGNSWNIEANGTIGRIGSTMVNSGLALSIDEHKFTGFQPLMTPDGKEFVIRGRPIPDLPGLQVQRRIRLVDETGILRYAEMIYNGSTDPVRVHVGVTTNFSGNYKTFLTNRGRTEPVLLEEGETGIVVLPGSTQSTRAYLFTLAAPGSAVKPAISAQNRYGLTFQFPVQLEPGETGIVLHHVAQVVIPQEFDRTDLLKLFRPRSFSENREAVPEDWEEFLVNAPDGADEAAAGTGRVLSGLEQLGIEPGPRDVLAIGERTRLYGEARGGSVTLRGKYGDAEIPWGKLAAISGKSGQANGKSRVYLRDGQIFTAEADIPDFAFVQTGGGTIDLDLKTLDRLVLARKEDEAASATRFGTIETHHGDRLEISDPASLRLDGITPWGPLPISFDRLQRLEPASSDRSGYEAELRDGTRCFVFLRGDDLSVTVDGFGKISFSPNELKRVFTKDAETGIALPDPTRATIRVAGDQRLVGDIGDSALPVVSGGIPIETAMSEIRRMERVNRTSLSSGGLPEESPSFEIERWDGGVLTGLITLDALTLKVGDNQWRIPISDIEQIETPSPELTPEALTRIQGLIGDLASEDWATREQATRELGAFGYLAKPVLRRELSSTSDPEVNRRLERILADMN